MNRSSPTGKASSAKSFIFSQALVWFGVGWSFHVFCAQKIFLKTRIDVFNSKKISHDSARSYIDQKILFTCFLRKKAVGVGKGGERHLTAEDAEYAEVFKI